MPLKLLGVTITRDNVRFPTHPTLFICSHDYEHIDLFTIAYETKKWKLMSGLDTVIITANKFHNKLFNMIIQKNGKCLFVTQGTTLKALNYLKSHHVCIFIYRVTTGTGAYYLTRNHRMPILVKIKSNTPACNVPETGIAPCLKDTLLSTFYVKYSILPIDYIDDNDANVFMNSLITILYS